MESKKFDFKEHFLKPILETQVSLISGIFLFVLFLALYETREIMVPIVFACLFNFLLAPVVNFLRRRLYIPPHIGAAAIILIVILAIGFICYGLTKPATTWINKGPEALITVDDKFSQLATFVATPLKTMSAINERITTFSNKAKMVKQDAVSIKESSGLMSMIALSTSQFLGQLTITVILLYFLLIYEDFLIKQIARWIPDVKMKKAVIHVIHAMQGKIFNYLFARTVINIALGIAVSMAMFMMGMPDPILWGVLTAVLEFIPYLGAIVAFVVIALVALFSFASLAYAMLVAFVFFLIVFIEANIIAPIMIGKAVLLNPITIFLSVVFWGWLWGVAGAFLAIPIMVIIKMIFESIYPAAQ